MPEVRQDLSGIVRHEPAKNLDSSFLDVVALVLHAVEEHQEVFVLADERIELGIEVLEHGDADAVFIISRGRHKELMKKLVDDALHS